MVFTDRVLVNPGGALTGPKFQSIKGYPLGKIFGTLDTEVICWGPVGGGLGCTEKLVDCDSPPGEFHLAALATLGVWQ